MSDTKPAPRRLPLLMTIREAQAIAGTLGHPSKMPGYSYGISAKHCITGAKLRQVPGSVCRSCYAMTDWYRTWRPLLQGHQRRWDGLRHPRWVDAMVTMISRACKPPNHYFRWHDSGDLQGVWHLRNIVAVCERTPDVRHWLPTREFGFVEEFVATGKVPENLVIRLSAMMIDSEPVIPDSLKGFPTSAVATAPQSMMGGYKVVDWDGAVECQAVEKRDNQCGKCRACWEPRVTCVTYPAH